MPKHEGVGSPCPQSVGPVEDSARSLAAFEAWPGVGQCRLSFFVARPSPQCPPVRGNGKAG